MISKLFSCSFLFHNLQIKAFTFFGVVVILFAYSNIHAENEEIQVDQSYLLEVENRKSDVLEAERSLRLIQREIETLENEKQERQALVERQQLSVDAKEKEVNIQKNILQKLLNELLLEEAKKSELAQSVLQKDTEIDAKRILLTEQVQEVERKKELVQQANTDVSRQRQLLLEQKQAEDRELQKRQLLKDLERIRTNLSELGVSFTGAMTGNAINIDQIQEGSSAINSQLKQCERNVNLVDNRDGTISDRSTGLMWQKCSLGEKYDPDSNMCILYAMASNAYNVQERLRLFNREQEFLNRYSRDRGGSSYYSDWKLPSATELKSLVKEPCAQDPTYYYNNMFDATKKERYITSSFNNEGESIFIDFANGQLKYDIPESSGYVRLVR